VAAVGLLPRPFFRLKVGYVKSLGTAANKSGFDFCLTVHHQLGKVIKMNQLDATMIY